MNTIEEESKTIPQGIKPNFDDTDCSDEEERKAIIEENNRGRSVHRPEPPNPYPSYISVPVNSLHEKFIRDVFKALMDEAVFFNEEESRKKSPFEYKSPSEISDLIDFELRETGSDHDSLLALIKSIIKYSPHPGHPYYLDQHSAGLDPFGIVADLVSTAFNNNACLYLVAPSYTIMEFEVIRSVSILAGYTNETTRDTRIPPNVDGVITPGGALGNAYAFYVAVSRKFPNIKCNGIFSMKRPVVFVSKAAQYAYNKAVILQGFGLQSVVPIRCNEKGQMDISDLRFRVAESKILGHEPVMVVATAGTSILRAFDSIDEIADIAQEYGLWLHLDATWGGGCLLSKTHKTKLKGIERSDSFVWSQHFMLSVPFTSAVLVLHPKHKNALFETLGLKEDAKIAFVDTPLYDKNWDTGNHHIQTSRRPEIFKFWLMWKAKGISGMGQHVDRIFDNAKFCVEEIKKRPSTFKLILEEFEGTNVSFLYIPPTLRGLNRHSEDFKDKINKVAPTLQHLLRNDGIMNISTHKLQNTPNFLTIALHSSTVTRDDIVYLLNQIENYGKTCAALTWKWSTEGLYQ